MHPESNSNLVIDGLQMMRFSVDRAADSIFWLSREGSIIYVNDAACAERGYSRDEMLGMKIFDLDPDYQSGIWELHFEDLKRRGTITLETRHRTKDGRVYPVEVSANYIHIGENEFNFCFLRDISSRKQAEQESRASEEKWRLLFENMPSGFALHEVISDEKGKVVDYRFLEINPAYEQLTGLKSSNIIGHTVLEVLPDTEAYWIETFGNVALSGESTSYENYSKELGKWFGVRAFSPKIGQFAVMVSDITERKTSEEKIQHLAFHDHLTNLPNRILLLDRLHQAFVSSARNGRKGGLMLIDLDNFKNLNDTLGHDMGDMLLKAVSQRLESSLRECDSVARLGGDEFVVMLLDLSGELIEAAAQIETIGEKILSSLSQPYELNSNIYRCTASVGVTLFSGNQQAADELLKQADIAMYQAKKAGRNTLRFFDRKMQESISARVSMESELRNAFEFQQFHLYYQLQVDSTLRPVGAEALIRWIHPERGMVSPAQFIPLAEETELILPIGNWVLDAACAQLNAWQQNAQTHELTLAVNVSAKQFREADFISRIETAIQHYGIIPRMLKLELTESMLLENIDDTIATMNALKAIGVQLSLDDFGTGYSSLQYLKKLPLSQIKIDQTFVRDIATDPNDASIVQTIIAMADALGLTVIAEGVETKAQHEFLELRGCHAYQGYLFGKPVPIEEFAILLNRS